MKRQVILLLKMHITCDPVSAFGGIIACNFKIDKKIAHEINKNFSEVVLARGFQKDALNILNKKKNLRVIDISNYKKKNTTHLKTFDRSFLLQDKIGGTISNVNVQKQKIPTKKEMAEIEFAFNISKYIKSNAIVLA